MSGGGSAKESSAIELSPGWQTILEIAGWVGPVVVVWSMMQQRILRLRVYNLIACVVQVLDNGVPGVWPVAALNVVLGVVQVTNLSRLLRNRHDPLSHAVVEVRAHGRLLAHLLDRHREDIASLRPSFA